jgi:hypothetical protein
MATVQAKIRTVDGSESVVPIVVPEPEAVREFALALHSEGIPWAGDAFGWHAEYIPHRHEPPLQSRLPFSPAEFCIGESGVWFFSLMWEHGPGAAPVEFVDDAGIVRPEPAAQ